MTEIKGTPIDTTVLDAARLTLAGRLYERNRVLSGNGALWGDLLAQLADVDEGYRVFAQEKIDHWLAVADEARAAFREEQKAHPRHMMGWDDSDAAQEARGEWLANMDAMARRTGGIDGLIDQAMKRPEFAGLPRPTFSAGVPEDVGPIPTTLPASMITVDVASLTLSLLDGEEQIRIEAVPEHTAEAPSNPVFAIFVRGAPASGLPAVGMAIADWRDSWRFREQAQRAARYDGLLFVSPNGVTTRVRQSAAERFLATETSGGACNRLIGPDEFEEQILSGLLRLVVPSPARPAVTCPGPCECNGTCRYRTRGEEDETAEECPTCGCRWCGGLTAETVEKLREEGFAIAGPPAPGSAAALYIETVAEVEAEVARGLAVRAPEPKR